MIRLTMKAALVAASVLVVPATASAQNFVLEANAARAHSRWGGELGIGYRISMGGFAVTPTVGAFIYHGDNDRYYIDEFTNGDERCRDSTNGQFADDTLCNNVAAKAYGRIEATYTIPAAGFEFGGGARFSSEKVRPYGTIAVRVGPKLRLKGNLGDKYYALGVSGHF